MAVVMSKQLAEVIEQTEIDMFYSRLSKVQEVNGNPMGVDIKQFGGATCFSVQQIPGPSYNTVKGLTDDDEVHLDSILDFYEQKGIPVRFELTPGLVSSKLLTTLGHRGFYQSDFHTTLFKPLDGEREDEGHQQITIRELKVDEFQLFAEIYTKGFQMPSFLVDGVAMNNKVLHDSPNWTFYIASVDQVPAGVGVLFMKNQMATLAAAATVPDFTNKGVQTSLVSKRINKAISDKCRFVIGQAKFGSCSHRNMERAGMHMAYTKSICVKNI